MSQSCCQKTRDSTEESCTGQQKTGCTLDGKTHGSLKNTTITKRTAYYINAIQNNAGNPDSMKKAVFATPIHCESTDATP